MPSWRMILLTNAHICPACAGRMTIRWDQRRCAECNTRLFLTCDNFMAIREDMIPAFWVWFPRHSPGPLRGWVHSDHLRDAIPNDAGYAVAKPDANYGR